MAAGDRRAMPRNGRLRGCGRTTSTGFIEDMETTSVVGGARPARPSLNQRFFAAIYDPFLALGERRGCADRRAALLADLSGDTLEIGAGTGLNLQHYPADAETLVLTEPDPGMLRRLQRRAPAQVRVTQTPAESLGFPNESFDVVVSTFVLCTAPDPASALAEVLRVLRPTGRLVLLEHVLSQSPRLARRQRRRAKVWKAFAGGCRCDQDTVSLLAEAGFDVSGLRHETWRGMPSIVRPLVLGSLARPA
jgi:ubiquinone/menaquinone biosynthesis C-methylase UbiE